MSEALQFSVRELIGGGYDEFWRFKGRYRVCKGSRASKKSKTTALWFVINMMKYEGANALIIRKTYNTLAQSTYKEIKWAVQRLGVSHLWDFKTQPLEAIYKPTNQRIYFRGLDDPLKLTSITVETGYLCWAWIEEAYEIMDEAEFDMLDESIRGAVPAPLFKQITITLNPWNERHWIKERFFDSDPDPDILAMTTNYLCNEWLDEADLKVFETMRVKNPRRYQVAGLGNWGISEGVIYDNWYEEGFELSQVKGFEQCVGVDFGYSNDPTALFVGYLDRANETLYVWDELYEKGLTNQDLYKRIEKMGYKRSRIIADSAEPKSIEELKRLGLRKITGARKGRDSINNGIQFVQRLDIVVHPRCVNFLTEISNYAWDKDKFGKALNKPVDDFNHLMDAMRYALEDHISKSRWLY